MDSVAEKTQAIGPFQKSLKTTTPSSKEKIYTAFQSRRMAVRELSSCRAESEYLTSESPSPRPTTLIAPGHPIPACNLMRRLVIGIHVSEENLLYFYKKDAATQIGMDACDRKKRAGAKLVSPDFESIYAKQDEILDRMSSIYPETTSGHYTLSGEFKPGKEVKEKGYFSCELLPYNELVITHYDKDQFLGGVITTDHSIIRSDTKKNWMSIFQEKKQLESAVGFNEQPVIFYDAGRGMIIDVCRLDELLPENKTLDDFNDGVVALSDYCDLSNINKDELSFRLWQLGPRAGRKYH